MNMAIEESGNSNQVHIIRQHQDIVQIEHSTVYIDRERQCKRCLKTLTKNRKMTVPKFFDIGGSFYCIPCARDKNELHKKLFTYKR